MINWNKESSFSDVINNNKIVIFEFGSESCGACHSIRYKLSEWLEGVDGVEGYYVSVDENMELAAELGIFTSPAVLVYVDGKLTVREAGYFGLEQIQRDVMRYRSLFEDSF